MNFFTRCLVLVPALLVLLAMFVMVSYLNETPYMGFELQDRALPVIGDPAPPPFQPGDIPLAVDHHTIQTPGDWRSALSQIPTGTTARITLTRQGMKMKLEADRRNLDHVQIDLRPESTVVTVLSAPTVPQLKAGDRVLSIAGRSMDGFSGEDLSSFTDPVNSDRFPLVVLSSGQIRMLLIRREDLSGVSLMVNPKYPVFISDIRVATDLKITAGDQLLSIDGKPVWNSSAVNTYVRGKSFQDEWILNIRSGDEFRTIITQIHFSQWDRRYAGNLLYMLCLVFGFILSTLILFQMSDLLLAVLQALFFSGFSCLLLADWKILFPGAPLEMPWLIPVLAAFPLLLILLLSHFPIPLHRLKKNRWWWALLAVWWALCGAAYVMATLPAAVLLSALKIGAVWVALLLLVHSFSILLGTREIYQQLPFRIIYIGLALGILLPLGGFFINTLYPETLLSAVPALMVFSGLNIPLTMLYSNIRKQVLYTETIFKKSLAYTLVSGIILFAYFLIVIRLGKYLHGLLNLDNIWVMLVFLMLAAFLVEPLKNVVVRMINRLFYRSQMSSQEFVLDISRQLNYLMDLPSILDLTLNRICDAAHLGGGYVLLREAETEVLECKAAREPEIERLQEINLPLDWEVVRWIRENREPIELFDRRNYKKFQELPAVETERLHRLGVSVIAALFSRNELLGVLLLKRKLSGELYTSEDLSVLSILCSQAAIALDNAMFREREKAMLHSSYQQKRLALMGQMAANIAHEIRNPLVAIKGLGKLVEDHLTEENKLKRHMHVLNSEVSRLQNVVSELVRFVRPSDLKKSEIDLNRLVEDTVQLYAEEINKNAIQLDFVPQDGPLIVEADPDKVKQVLINLLQNALEAVPRGGRIRVETVAARPEEFMDIYSTSAILRVWDSGPLIDPELHAKIFEPFFTSKGSGTGLGLAIVKDIMEEHGGSVSLIQDGEHQKYFEVRFPVETMPGGP
ncbi:MAG: GAF domain-containing protein [Acidobacteria bacterium]|nr:GAF domain-containing protein [Acidobacteriota bacterium]